MLKKTLLLLGLILILILVYGYIDFFYDRPEVLPQPQGAISHFVTAPDGVKIHYLTMGQGQPVLLIHGYFANAYLNWFQNGIAQELAKTNLVIALDARGHGESDKPYEASAYGEHMWKDALLVLDDLKIKKAHMHGYSMGGSILTQILFHSPQRVLTATYGGSGVPEKETDRPIFKDPKTPESIEKEEDLAQEKVKNAFAHDFIAMALVAKNAPWSGPEAQKIDLTQIKIPVLAIVGEFDSPQKRIQRMKRELPNFKAVVLPGKAHLTSITAGFMPKSYMKECTEFIKAYDRTHR